MDFENFTDKTVQAIGAARKLALEKQHVQILPVHLMLALLEEQDGLAVQVFKKAGADIQQVKRGFTSMCNKYEISLTILSFLVLPLPFFCDHSLVPLRKLFLIVFS